MRTISGKVHKCKSEIAIQVAKLGRRFNKIAATATYLLIYGTIAFAVVYVPVSFYLILVKRLFGWTTVPDPALVFEEIISGKLFTWWRPDIPRFLLDSTLLLIECVGFLFCIYLYAMIAGTLESYAESAESKITDPKEYPFASILIPTRNTSLEVVLETLEGAVNQDYPDELYEVLLVDNGTDKALSSQLKHECAARGVKYLFFLNVQGFKAAALNFGLQHAKGNYITVLDADQIPVSNLLRRLIAGFDSPDTAYTVAKVRFRNAKGIISKANALIHMQFYEVVEVAKSRRGMTLFAGSTGCFRKDLLMEIGGFQEETLIEDIDTSTVLLQRGYKGKLVNQVGSWGLAPITCRQQIGQLWRWAHGATAILRHRSREVMRSKIPFTHRMELILNVSAFVAGLATFFFTIGTAVLFVDDSRPFRPFIGTFPLYLMMPTLVILGHLGETFLALLVEENDSPLYKRLFELIPFYLLSFAVFPFLISAAIGGFFGRDSLSQEDTPWNPETNFGRNAMLVFVAGLFLLATGLIAILRLDYGVGLLFIALGLCYIVPLPLCGFENLPFRQKDKGVTRNT
jgi:cellulose synthase (UDP-forming)